MKVDHITVICFFLEKNGKRRIKKLLQMEVDPLPVSQVPPFSAPPPEQKKYWKSLYNRCASLIHTLWKHWHLLLWQFDWCFDNLIYILTIWFISWQFDWYFDNLIDILTIWLTFWNYQTDLIRSWLIWSDFYRSGDISTDLGRSGQIWHS